ncbi:hypothetical protein EJ04DRAFT_575398 [Polyplosphaeria fusca]|uniref:Zn(2)-C6 fungal-type domain-containing protein n=1 Tax=Polyplosphaeria fusca TaxID=682080 RepID=A0A9P4QYY0_9PLEO|nr:hypothetical protein EJ04DRAFT_575398 [Polyplosphaeria fusca]
MDHAACDETKPVCNRCKKSNHDCRYRDQGDILFRNQTAVAAQKAEDSWRKRAKSSQRVEAETHAQTSPPSDHHSPGSNASHESTPGSEASTSQLNIGGLSIAKDSKAELRRAAYERLLYDFVILETPGHPAELPSDSLWDFIPHLYEKAAEGSCFKYTVDCVSYANYGARKASMQAQALAEEYIGKAITSVQKAIADPKQAKKDEVLASVYLLGLYENLTSANYTGAYLAHKEGANALLKLRTIREFYKDPISARLYEITFSQMLLGNLQTAKPPTMPIDDVIAARQDIPHMHNASGIYVIQLVHNEATLHAKWHELKCRSNAPSSREELFDILHEALELDADFQTWESTVPPVWKYETERNTPETRSKYSFQWTGLFLDSRGAPSEILRYTSLKKAWLWTFFRTTRLFLLRDCVEILNWMLKMPEPLPTQPGKFRIGRKALDDTTLTIHHAFCTTHLVNLIEKSCSAVLGHFVVPISGKSDNDVMGMRGYASLWCLGVVDAILRMGLAPDSGPPRSPSPPHQFRPPSAFSSTPMPTPAMFRLPPQNQSPLYYNSQAAIPTPSDLPNLDSIPPNPTDPMDLLPPYLSDTTPSPSIPTGPGAIAATQALASFESYLPRPHTSPTPPFSAPPPAHNSLIRAWDWESSDLHEMAMPDPGPPAQPAHTSSVTAPQPSKIDVVARREWIRGVLWYMGNDLGIKKALAAFRYGHESGLFVGSGGWGHEPVKVGERR